MKRTALAPGNKSLLRRTPLARGGGLERLTPMPRGDKSLRRSWIRRAASAVVRAITPSREATDILIADAGLHGLPLTYGTSLPAEPICRRSAKQSAKVAAWIAITAAKIALGECCQRCGCSHCPALGWQHRLAGHHRRLASQGGAWDESNHVLLCNQCHTWAHANVAAAVAEGWIIQGRAA